MEYNEIKRFIAQHCHSLHYHYGNEDEFFSELFCDYSITHPHATSSDVARIHRMARLAEIARQPQGREVDLDGKERLRAPCFIVWWIQQAILPPNKEGWMKVEATHLCLRHTLDGDQCFRMNTHWGLWVRRDCPAGCDDPTAGYDVEEASSE